MDATKKAVLASAYLAGISGGDIASHAKKALVPDGEVGPAVDSLVGEGLVGGDKRTVTKEGRARLRIVLAGGVFDIIHPGHIHTLNAARQLGDALVVVVATDSTAVRMKKRKPLHSEDERKELVGSLSMVDLCLVGQEGDIFKTVGMVRPQVIALGYDQAHQEQYIRDGCKGIGLDAEVARLESPIPESSSSKIQSEYGESIHGI